MFCWFYKLLISHNLDNKSKNSRFVEKHLANCKNCCQFYNYAKNLEGRLIEDAKSLQDQTFSNTVDITKFKQSNAPATKMKSALLAAAACLAIAVIFSAVVNVQKANETKRLRQAKSQETLKFALSTHSLITKNMQTQNSALKLSQAMAKPYKNEIDTIKNETKTALRFLVSCIEVHIDDKPKNTTVN